MFRKSVPLAFAVLLLTAAGLAIFFSRGPQPDPAIARAASPAPREPAPSPTPRAEGGRTVAIETEAAVHRAEPMHSEDEDRNARTRAEVLVVLTIDSSGLPVPSVEIELFRAPQAAPLERAMTDAVGRATLADPRPGDEIHARVAGFVDRVAVLGERPWPQPLELRLARGVTALWGRVIDQDRAPVGRARLSLSGGGRELSAVSDAEGSFELHVDPDARLPAEVAIWLSAPDHGCLGNGALVPLPAPGTLGWELTMHRWAQLAVRVTDGNGMGIATARAALLGAPDSEQRDALPAIGGPVRASPCEGSGGSTSEDPGRLCFTRVPPTVPLWLAVEEPALGRTEIGLGELAPGEQREVTVQLAGEWSPSRYRICAVDSAGRPVTRGRVVIESMDGSSSTIAWRDLDERGCVDYDPPGASWSVQVQAEGYSVAHLALDGADPVDESVEVVLEASEVSIRVRVVDSTRAPRSGVPIRIEKAGGIGGMRLLVRTDETGLAEYAGVDPDMSFRVTVGSGRPGVYADGEAEEGLVSSPAAHRGVRGGDPELEFVLVPGGAIAGKVVGEGLGGARVHVSCFETEGAPPPPVFTVGTVLSADGEFFFGGLPPGRYHLWSPATPEGPTFEKPLASFDLQSSEEIRDLLIRR